MEASANAAPAPAAPASESLRGWKAILKEEEEAAAALQASVARNATATAGRRAQEIAEAKVQELRRYLEDKATFPVPVMVDRAEAYREMIVRALEAKFGGAGRPESSKSSAAAVGERRGVKREVSEPNSEDEDDGAEGRPSSKKPRKGDEDGIALR
jgi:hypothetical protein